MRFKLTVAYFRPLHTARVRVAMASVVTIWILNDLFYDQSPIAGPAEMSIPFLFSEKPTFVPVGSAGERSGGA
jgi:hypothetical protein